VHAHLLEQLMQVGKKCNGASISAQGARTSRKTSVSSNRSSGPLTIAALWSGEFSEPAATFLGDIQKSRHPAESLTLASAKLIGFVFEHRLNLIPKLWAILVSMR
jgi:hypothetical protein